ncbi:hypothetical protein LCGC14_2926390 [marine sediment metagenome]|uniref:DUF2190 domain-containing protein n=1 Tax=marine sediment metagenome TaxID=412755 RepID=A0A0F8Y913_9ZZZZ
MANETQLMIETEIPIAFKVADGAAIPKGSFVKLTESMTAIITSGQKDMIAGITAEEKIINDGKVTVPVYMGGIFKGVAGAVVAIGAPLMMDATVNRLETASTVTGAAGVGYALEAPSGDGQTFLFRLQIGNSTS